MQTEIQIRKLEEQALTWPEKVASMAVIDQPSYDLAAEMILDINVLINGIKAEKDPLVASAYDTHKRLTADRNKYLIPPEAAKKMLQEKARWFERDQASLRIAAQAVIDKANREKAEADQRKREAVARALMAEAMAEQAKVRARDEEIRLEMALNAPEELQAAILAAPVLQIPAVASLDAYIAPAAPMVHQIIAPTFDRAKGLGIRTTVDVRVTNIKLLAAAVADGRMPESFVEANLVALRGRARSDGSAFSVPGVERIEK